MAAVLQSGGGPQPAGDQTAKGGQQVDQALRMRAMHFNSIAIGVGRAVMPSVVRQGAVAGSGKNSAHTAL